ncbi:MAG: hypothetical protein JWL70_184 [Acidimicrobiia bacterium]|nr:hypothetical protein [Acidimicrobiia bacterium]
MIRRRWGAIAAATAVASLSLALTTPVTGAAAAVAAPTQVWTRALPGAAVSESSPALVDLAGTGTLDAVFGAFDGKLYALQAATGGNTVNWPQPTLNPIDSSPSFADVDGDGKPELFVGSGTFRAAAGGLYSFRSDGSLRFRKILPDRVFPNPSVHSTPAIGDVNGDGRLDLAVGTLGLESSWMLDNSSATLPGSPLYWNDTIFSSPAIVDVNNDGVSDVIIGGDASGGFPNFQKGGMVRALNGGQGQIWQFLTTDIIRSSPSVGDVDGDGKLDVVFGTGDYWGGTDSTSIICLDAATGVLKWKRATDGVVTGSPALADVNGDGRLDVAFGTFNSTHGKGNGGSVYAISGTNGADLAGFPKPSGGGVVLGSVVTADVDGDGGQDIFAPTGALIAVFSGKTGAKLFNLGEGQGVGFSNSPAIADVDGNGRIDVIAAGTKAGTANGVAIRWELDPTAKLGAKGWHQFRRDGRRTGSWASGVGDAGTLAFTRAAGADRYATAVAASRGFTNADTVYVATGTAYADALAGGPAAAAVGAVGAPMLLVASDQVPASTRQRLSELHPRRIVVLGGPAAVSDAVVAELSGLASGGATRVAGGDRYATAAAISAQAFSPGIGVAYVVTGLNFPDALAGASAAAKEHGAVLLVAGDSIPKATSDELRRLAPQAIVVLGGTSAVSASVVQALQAFTTGSVTRVSGASRYDTAVAVSRRSSANGAGTVYLATGANFPDALAGGPVAGAAGSPLLLVPGRCLPGAVRTEIDRLGANRLVLLGGEGAVSASVASLSPC